MRPICLLLVCWFSVSGGTCTAAVLTLTTEDLPPFNIPEQDGVSGIGGDKVAELMRRVGVSFKVQVMPWSRAYQTALRQRATCVFSTARTELREASFKWVGPIANSEWVMYGLGVSQFRPENIEQARPLRIGTYHGDVIEEYLGARGYHIHSALSDTVNPQLLLEGKIDLWASDRFEASAMLVKSGLRGRIVPLFAFNASPLYLACNPSVEDDLIRRLSRALADMQRDGTTDNIDRRYDRWPLP